MAAGVISLTFEGSDIAVLTLDDPNKGANVLSACVLAELETHLDGSRKAPRSGRAGHSLGQAGLVHRRGRSARVRRVARRSARQIVAMCNRGRRLFQRLSQMPFVTVAAIDGICVGGGAELAIWCDRRIMSDDAKAQFGFPEVKLGLFPGWGARPARRAWSGWGTPSRWSPAANRSTPSGGRDGPGQRRGTAGRAACGGRFALLRAEAAERRLPARSRALERTDRHQRNRAGLSRRHRLGLYPAANQWHYPAPAAALESDARRGRGSTSTRPARWKPKGWRNCSARRLIGRCSTCSS